MKIFEITEASKYATPGDGSTGDERMRRVQQMARAGVDTTTATRDLGRADYSGIDPEDLQAKKIRQGASDELRKATAARDKKEREKERKEQARQRKLKLKKDREDRKDIQRQADKERRDRRGREAKSRQDKRMGYRKDAAGRTLRAPRYYRNKTDRGKTSTGRDPNRSAFRRGIDSLIDDPGYAIADFYNDRVSRIKDFLHQEF